ncbi:MAG: hypothetical protein KJ583_07055 [Nanoarchaeota archaeon]|nr:hypothetical protein [Nanoarchaeota archaeon]MBU1269196.1 hypothetical protein [Nanoarchaeota archaeon]MBU1605044.1 hypothetical protein [Nanoarchaeota archaeon]MBU2442881.1 hypothetical protein [Nanoarchaeota archaeon]
MIGAKVKLEKAEEVKIFLIKKKLLDFDHQNLKDSGHIIFPVVKKFESKDVKFIETNFIKKTKQKNWKELLKEKLSEEEYSKLITAYDVVGTIAILEIPPKLENKEKIIAETLLKTNKNIKTVLKKAGEHTGVFRTQKMNWLAGENTKETVHKENNVELRVDVEKTYFSTRLGTERKRITAQIKKDEHILVMFSGVAPYPLVFSKNTNAKNITGIEINKKAHELGEENIIINKAGNVNLIKGDVKKLLPNIYKQIIGLKSNIKKQALNNRIKEKPLIYELYATEKNIVENKELEKVIKLLKNEGVEEIFIHAPHVIRKGEELCLDEDEMLKSTLKFLQIVKKHKVNAIIHPSNKKRDYKTLIQNINMIKKKFPIEFEKNIYFENLITPHTFSDVKGILTVAKKTKMKNICIDPAHHYKSFESNDELELFIKELKSNFKTYFHLNGADKNGGEGLKLDQGSIDLKRILSFVNKGIVEVVSNDEQKGTEMIKSYDALKEKKMFFDRICMPLPKSAENFLKYALLVSKKGTIIHFYDFLHEEEFEKCEEKVKSACKKSRLKYKKLDFVKCGQYSPRKFRVCLDFQIV